MRPSVLSRGAARALRRRSQAVQPAPDHAGGRRRRSAQAEGGEGAVHRRRRARLAGGDVSGRGRRRHASASSTSTSSTSATCSGRSFTARRTSGAPKLASAKDRAERAQSERRGRDATRRRSAPRTRCDLFKPYDVILDGTDNFPTRYLVNDACVLLGKPNAYGSIFRFEGQASVFATKDGPCYRCLYPEPPPPGLVPSCAEGGVFGVLPGIIGVDSGDRDDQADPRYRRAVDRPLPDLRRAADALSRVEAAEGR